MWIFDAEVAFALQNGLAYVMVALAVLSVLAGLAYDIWRKIEPSP